MDESRLKGMGLFSGFDDRELRVLAGAMRDHSFLPFEVVFRKGDRAAGCYFVLDGGIEVSVEGVDGREETVATLGKGELFGEVALIDGGLRSATCRATIDGAELVSLGRAEFDQVFNAGNAFAYKLMDLIGERVIERVRTAADELYALARASVVSL